MRFNPAIVLLACLLPITAFSQVDDSAAADMRKPRKAAVMVELGVNGLASMAGIAGSYYFKPNMAIDLGLGVMSINGLRPGLRYRYLFSSSDFSPFVGAGLKYGLGSDGKEIEAKDPNSSNADFKFKVKPESFADLCGGFDFQADNGFFMLGVLGWSQRISGGPGWESTTPGLPVEKTKKAYDFLYDSGPIISFAAGWAF